MDDPCKIQGSIHVLRLVNNICPGKWVHIKLLRTFSLTSFEYFDIKNCTPKIVSNFGGAVHRINKFFNVIYQNLLTLNQVTK